MTWVVPKLRDRLQIKIPVQTENDAGGFDRSYSTLLTVWGEFKPTKFGFHAQAAYIRGEQIKNVITHEFVIRRSSIASLGKGFSSGFSTGFNQIADLTPLKSDYFLFVQRGSTIKGRVFKVHKIQDHQERREFIILFCEEIEEQGTGYSL
jgi:head-tail adaptor